MAVSREHFRGEALRPEARHCAAATRVLATLVFVVMTFCKRLGSNFFLYPDKYPMRRVRRGCSQPSEGSTFSAFETIDQE